MTRGTHGEHLGSLSKDRGRRGNCQAEESAGWMPRRQEPKKDAETGETWMGSCNKRRTSESEWGNPSTVMGGDRALNEIGYVVGSAGTETSQYRDERKSNEIPVVAASETGSAQTGGARKRIMRGCRRAASPGNREAWPSRSQRKLVGNSAVEGESPVRDATEAASETRSLSTTGHVKSCGKQGGPPSKAKYSLATDRERVP